MPALTCPGCGAAAAPEEAACAYCSRSLATIGCANCFGRIYPGMSFCPSCGARESRPDASIPTVLACPGCAANKCTSSLQRITIGAREVHECLACAGLWLDTQSVVALETDAAARAPFSVSLAADPSNKSASITPKVAPIRYRRCPVCADVMSRVNVARISGVVVDRCNEHGTYFDVDELHELVQFLEGGGIDRARARERQALAEERRQMNFTLDLARKKQRFEVVPDSERGSPVATAILKMLANSLLDRH